MINLRPSFALTGLPCPARQEFKRSEKMLSSIATASNGNSASIALRILAHARLYAAHLGIFPSEATRQTFRVFSTDSLISLTRFSPGSLRQGETLLWANKERTPSQISNEARPSALDEIRKRRAKWGHTICPIHFPQPSTQLHPKKIGRFRSKPDTQLRVSPFFRRDADAAPTDKDFSVRRNQLHPPRVKDQRPYGFHRKHGRRISYFTACGQDGDEHEQAK